MLSAAIETYRSKTVFLYRVSDPLSSTVEIVERERERELFEVSKSLGREKHGI